MSLFHQDPGLFIWTLITFGLLFALLSRFAFKPLKEALAERERLIRDSVAAAESAQAAAEKLQAESAGRIHAAREDALKIIEEAHRLAARLQKESLETSRRETDALLQRAHHEIQIEVRRSMDELKGTVASLSMDIARRFIREGFDEKRHEQLVDEVVGVLLQANEEEKVR